MWAHQTQTAAAVAAMKRSTSGSVAWGRTSTWSWRRPRRAWSHLASPSRSWERTAPRAWGPTTRATSAFTRGHWGRGSTPRWHCPHARGWWVWTRTKVGLWEGRDEKEGAEESNLDRCGASVKRTPGCVNLRVCILDTFVLFWFWQHLDWSNKWELFLHSQPGSQIS